MCHKCAILAHRPRPAFNGNQQLPPQKALSGTAEAQRGQAALRLCSLTGLLSTAWLRPASPKCRSTFPPRACRLPCLPASCPPILAHVQLAIWGDRVCVGARRFGLPAQNDEEAKSLGTVVSKILTRQSALSVRRKPGNQRFDPTTSFKRSLSMALTLNGGFRRRKWGIGTTGALRTSAAARRPRDSSSSG